MIRFAPFLLLLLSSPALADIEVEFSPGHAAEAVVGVIDSAQKTVHVAAFSFTSRPIADALIAARKRGVSVMAVLDRSNATARYSSAGDVARNGVAVRIDEQYSILHDKFLIIDGKTVETGSMNFTRAGQFANAENILILRDDPATAAAYEREWVRMWNESRDFGGEAP